MTETWHDGLLHDLNGCLHGRSIGQCSQWRTGRRQPGGQQAQQLVDVAEADGVVAQQRVASQQLHHRRRQKHRVARVRTGARCRLLLIPLQQSLREWLRPIMLMFRGDCWITGLHQRPVRAFSWSFVLYTGSRVMQNTTIHLRNETRFTKALEPNTNP